MGRGVDNHPEFNILGTTPGRTSGPVSNSEEIPRLTPPGRRRAEPSPNIQNLPGALADQIDKVLERSRRQAPPPPVKTGRRAAPPPPMPWWHKHDPYNQPGEPASGGQIPNPPDYCDARWLTGPTGTQWVDMAFCASCADSKLCEGLKGYHAATNAKNNGRTHKKEWEDGTEDE